ncbi:hypothetical protein HHI36_010540 [Cryptolaemus montrouzieri]|uniref:GAG-pre-integrase domain-containing protein n=1 Tax=Cryptolaemus montrouzieri TaxID=559131 RepID=A0ABD2MJ09_9CUCU
MSNVLHVPKITANLFSVRAAISKGYHVKMEYDKCSFLKNNKVGAVVYRTHKMYKMGFRNEEHENANVERSSEHLGEWHKRFAHQNIEQVKQMLKRSKIEDILKVIGSENINPQTNVEIEELENEISHEDIASENEIMYEEVKSIEGNSEDDTSYASVEEQENNRRLRKTPKNLADYETSH